VTIHADLAGRWGDLTLAEQLANVGSEVERTIAAWDAKRMDRFERALERALELFAFTVRDERWRGHRRREILRTREEFLTLFFGDDPSPASAAGLRRLFLGFGILARRGGGGGVGTPILRRGPGRSR
jgi:hypothetical protein